MTLAEPLTAVDTARAALLDQVGEAAIGEHLGEITEGDGVTTYSFATRQAGYPGWHWAVTLAVLEGEPPTVDEIVLLPGDESITAPAWVPWRERIQPGDLSPGDILPTDEDDPRLVPGYLAGDVDGDREIGRVVADEVGLGRKRVMSLEGRVETADRWYAGVHGPDVPMAQSAPGKCGNCGFLVQLSGPLSATFGVCANAFANDDAQVVSFDHGCGAHSEAQLRRKQLPPPLADHVFDTLSRGDFEQF